LNAGYWEFPTRNNGTPSNQLSVSGTNNANYDSDYLTAVGFFSSSPGPYGTFDQGGDVDQWLDAFGPGGTTRKLRGGSWPFHVDDLASVDSSWTQPTTELPQFGFRVAFVPEPSTFVLAVLAALMVGLFGRS